MVEIESVSDKGNIPLHFKGTFTFVFCKGSVPFVFVNSRLRIRSVPTRSVLFQLERNGTGAFLNIIGTERVWGILAFAPKYRQTSGSTNLIQVR